MAVTLDRRLLRYAPQGVTQTAIQEARWWVADCLWADLTDGDVDTLPVLALVRGVDRHYAGGWQGFVAEVL
jgi:hypothetical protein